MTTRLSLPPLKYISTYHSFLSLLISLLTYPRITIYTIYILLLYRLVYYQLILKLFQSPNCAHLSPSDVAQRVFSVDINYIHFNSLVDRLETLCATICFRLTYEIFMDYGMYVADTFSTVVGKGKGKSLPEAMIKPPSKITFEYNPPTSNKITLKI